MASAIVTPTLLDHLQLEYSVHKVPIAHKEDVRAVFPNVNVDDILIVPTCQRAKEDLVKTGEKVSGWVDDLMDE